MVAVLTRIFGTENLQLAEDVVQETFLTAVQVWSLKGLPDEPSAWLMRCARNKAIDWLRRNKFSTSIDFSDPERRLLQSEYTLVTQMDKLWQQEVIDDELLRMMYTCCHPGIAPESQITLMLKTLCGFSVAEIARAFQTSEDTIAKRLYRTREFFRNHRIRPEFPGAEALPDATGTVLKAIYLIFNEGYHATHTEEWLRCDLQEQAMYLCRLLCNHDYTRQPQVYAAMALMCFHAARNASRMSADGEIVLLEHQDRSLWNRQQIDEGILFLNIAATGEQLSSYHIEAAIAYEHCAAGQFADTNWPRILNYYNLLLRLQPSAVVALNRLIVLYKVEGYAAAMVEAESSPYRKVWEQHSLFHSLMGEMEATQSPEKSTASYEKAIALTKSVAEKRLLFRKMKL
jgi:RNA polymerase sigma-70 factor (ECF subfamily)